MVWVSSITAIIDKSEESLIIEANCPAKAGRVRSINCGRITYLTLCKEVKPTDLAASFCDKGIDKRLPRIISAI